MPTSPATVRAPSGSTPKATQTTAAHGLTSDAAARLLAKDGANAVPDISENLLKNALTKFWAPVPWLLEGSILLELVLHKYVEATVIAGLLIFNAGLAYFQEGRAQSTLKALRSSLALNAFVQRDGVWKAVPATQLVCDDMVKLSLGGVVPADVRLIDGSVSLDQSMLTGESLPVEAGAGVNTYAGALVRRGEATALVTGTGMQTKFGRTAELVRTAHSVSSQQRAVLRIVRSLAIFNGVVILLIGGYAYGHHMPWSEIIPLLLTSVLAAIPVALPATFTLAAAVGASALVRIGVLPTRLSAVDEAATINVLCSDKTGTLTLNALSVTSVRPMEGYDEPHVLGLATLASSDGGGDSVDAAIRAACSGKPALDLPKLVKFVPFDPAKKISEATATDSNGNAQRIVKGAFTVVSGLAVPTPAAADIAAELERKGLRVLAVAAGPSAAMRLIGLIALSDPPRPDSAALISELRTLGVNTVMVTGDAAATAAIVAHDVGLDGAVCPRGLIPNSVNPQDFAVFASIPPEGKYNLVMAFQKNGQTVGMCGDGANDAPALRQAQIGIAVSTATDVAKSAAGMVLTRDGLGGIVAAVKEGRTTFQRILTYTLNSTTKKLAQVMLLAIGLMITGQAVLTPLLMVLVMITGDFLAMSLTTDRVSPSATPNSWQIGRIMGASVILGSCLLGFCVAALVIGKFELHLGLDALRTLSVVAIVFGSQANIYAIRDRKRYFGLRPTGWLLVSSFADVLIIFILASRGIAMSPLPLPVLFCEFAAAFAYGLMLCGLKIPVFHRFAIS